MLDIISLLVTPPDKINIIIYDFNGFTNIINEIKATYPDKKIKALIGGFHLFGKPKKEVKELAKRIKDTGIEMVYTGHCTGQKSYKVLKEELGDMVQQLRVGLEIEM